MADSDGETEPARFLSQDEIRKRIKSYFEVDTEIKAADKQLNGVKKRRKELSGEILCWMEHNGANRAECAGKGVIHRRTKKTKVALNAGYIQDAIARQIKDDDRSAEITRAIFDERDTKETAYIKVDHNK